MKNRSNKTLLIAVGLCLLFLQPQLVAFMTDSPIIDSNGRPYIWTALLTPTIPLILLLPYYELGTFKCLILQPIYLASIFWPLFVLGLRPELWEKNRWRSAIINYSWFFVFAMLCCAYINFSSLSR